MSTLRAALSTEPQASRSGFQAAAPRAIPAMTELNHETLDAYCLSKPEAVVETPFGPGALVYKVCGKMFALLSTEEASMNLKCDPTIAEELRERYAAVRPGYHMNKRHWNTVHWENDELTWEDLTTWIDESYQLVVSNLSRRQRAALDLIDHA